MLMNWCNFSRLKSCKNSDNFRNVKIWVVFEARKWFHVKFGWPITSISVQFCNKIFRWSKVANTEGSLRKCASPVTTFHDVFAFLTSYFQKSTEVVSGTNSTFWWFHAKLLWNSQFLTHTLNNWIFLDDIDTFVNTVWKFQDLSIMQILCEIDFEDFRSPKSAILTHLKALNFEVLEFLHFFEGCNSTN